MNLLKKMKTLFENVRLISGENVYVVVDGAYFRYVGGERPSGNFDNIKNWLMYVSHEGTITFAGEKLVKTAEEFIDEKYKVM